MELFEFVHLLMFYYSYIFMKTTRLSWSLQYRTPERIQIQNKNFFIASPFGTILGLLYPDLGLATKMIRINSANFNPDLIQYRGFL